MERSTPQTPRRVSVRRMLASAVSAIMAGQRIEFSGRGSRKMKRVVDFLVARETMDKKCNRSRFSNLTTNERWEARKHLGRGNNGGTSLMSALTRHRCPSHTSHSSTTAHTKESIACLYLPMSVASRRQR